MGSTRQVAVYAYSAPVDLRKGFDGLSALVLNDLGSGNSTGTASLGHASRRARNALLARVRYRGGGEQVRGPSPARAPSAHHAARRPRHRFADAVGQIATLADVLRPSYEALARYVLEAPIIGTDETWWRLMERPASKRWWVWSLTREDAVVYRILEARSQHAAREMLGSYAGIVIADGYGAYDALSRAGPGFTLAHCWAHVRRKFIEAEAHYPAPCRKLFCSDCGAASRAFSTTRASRSTTIRRSAA